MSTRSSSRWREQITEEREPISPLSTSQRAMLEEAVEAYETELLLDDGAAQYLSDRGLSPATVTRQRFGVVGDEPHPGHEKFKGMVAIPYLDRHGYPLTIRFRCIENHNHRDLFHGKYASVKHDDPRLYNIRAIHEADSEAVLDITEGEFDAAILQQIGLHAIALPGANLWRGSFRRMVWGFNQIRVWADPDEAGAEMTQRLTKSLRQAKPVRLKGGDVTDIYLNGGADALLKIARGE